MEYDNIRTAVIGGSANKHSNLFCFANYGIEESWSYNGFVKVTILDD